MSPTVEMCTFCCNYIRDNEKCAAATRGLQCIAPHPNARLACALSHLQSISHQAWGVNKNFHCETWFQKMSIRDSDH